MSNNLLLNFVIFTDILNEFVVLDSLEKHVVFNLFPLTCSTHFFELGKFFMLDSSLESRFYVNPCLLSNVIWDV